MDLNEWETFRSKKNEKRQGSLTEVEGLVQLTSLYKLISVIYYINQNIIYIFHKTSYLNEEVKCTQPSPSVSIPCKRYKKVLPLPSYFA